jgi:putative endonuclease
MYYVYVLQNPRGDELYYGFSSNLRQRFAEHQKISRHAGWKLVYYEAYLSETDARRRERKLKQYGQSRGLLKKRIAESLSEGLESAGDGVPFA